MPLHLGFSLYWADLNVSEVIHQLTSELFLSKTPHYTCNPLHVDTHHMPTANIESSCTRYSNRASHSHRKHCLSRSPPVTSPSNTVTALPLTASDLAQHYSLTRLAISRLTNAKLSSYPDLSFLRTSKSHRHDTSHLLLPRGHPRQLSLSKQSHLSSRIPQKPIACQVQKKKHGVMSETQGGG